MWIVTLLCDGCEARAGSVQLEKGDTFREAKAYLRDDVPGGWKPVRSPDDGECWHCRTCAAARSGRPLVAVAGDGKGGANG